MSAWTEGTHAHRHLVGHAETAAGLIGEGVEFIMPPSRWLCSASKIRSTSMRTRWNRFSEIPLALN